MVSTTQDLQQIEEELRWTRQLLEAFVNNAAVAFLVCDLEGRVLRTNRTFERTFGWREEHVQGDVLPVVPEEARSAFLRTVKEHGYQLSGAEQVRQRRDGSTFVASETVVPMPSPEGGMRGFALIMRDITFRKGEERRLKESEMRYRSLFEHNPDAVFMVDLNGVFMSINPATERITGYTEAEMIGKSYEFFTVPEDIERSRVHLAGAVQGTTQNLEMAIVNKQGQRVDLNVISLPIQIEGELIGVYGIAKDITEAKRAERVINHMAYHDSLTDLPNRRLFEDRLVTALEEAHAKGERVAVLFLDLDRFKAINDTLGHAAGDRVLMTVADRLRECVRDTDLVARMSGDEFTLILPDVKECTAETVAQRVLESLRRPLFLGMQDYHITASIGIGIYPDHGGDAAALMKRADSAMYRAKGLGKNTWQLYQPSLDSEMLDRMKLEQDLRRAVEREEFVVHYQPQVNVETGRIIGMEALVRWMHPERGLLAPGAFIPLAEETGLIVPIGESVLRQAVAQCKAWQDAGYPPLRVAVNLSFLQFEQDDLVETIRQVLDESGYDPQYLELEITESIAMQHPETVIAKLNQLVALGVQIAIDDFGTGFSSLNYLTRLPVHKLKIDRSFISDIDNESYAVIVSAIVSMAYQLRLSVIVEGVETETQRESLPKLGCREMQGYLFSAPLTAERFEETLLKRQNC